MSVTSRNVKAAMNHYKREVVLNGYVLQNIQSVCGNFVVFCNEQKIKNPSFNCERARTMIIFQLFEFYIQHNREKDKKYKNIVYRAFMSF